MPGTLFAGIALSQNGKCLAPPAFDFYSVGSLDFPPEPAPATRFHGMAKVLRRNKMSPSPRLTLVFAALLLSALAAAQTQNSIPTQHNEATIAQLQADMASGKLTSEGLTQEYISRILALDQGGPGVNSVIELNPDALVMARNADALRRRGVVLGPLHGIPVLLKDNIDTGDQMQTSAGSEEHTSELQSLTNLVCRLLLEKKK